MMFLIAQFPIADLRGLRSHEMGRLAKPDWRADDPGDAFLRGFGPLTTRSAGGYSVIGERCFAEMPQALRYKSRAWYSVGNAMAEIVPWFRRLYFDGECTGRIELAFAVPYASSLSSIDPGTLAAKTLDIEINVRIADTPDQLVTIGTCREALGYAFLAATTRRDTLNSHPIAETYGKHLFVGDPTFHLRSTGEETVEVRSGSRVIALESHGLWLTPLSKGPRRHSVVVQQSERLTFDESPDERAIRVLFAHLNSLIFALSKVATIDRKESLDREKLKELVPRVVDRLANFTPLGPKERSDVQFAEAVKVFGAVYKGRIEELEAKLGALANEISAQTPIENALDYAKHLFELILTTGVKATVEAATRTH